MFCFHTNIEYLNSNLKQEIYRLFLEPNVYDESQFWKTALFDKNAN